MIMKHAIYSIAILLLTICTTASVVAESTDKDAGLPATDELIFLFEQAMSRVPKAMREAAAIEAYRQDKMHVLRGPFQLELWMLEVRFDIKLKELKILEKRRKREDDDLIFDVSYIVENFGECTKLPEAAAAFNAMVKSGGKKNSTGEARLYVRKINEKWTLTSLQSKGSIDWVEYLNAPHEKRMELYPIPFDQYEKKK